MKGVDISFDGLHQNFEQYLNGEISESSHELPTFYTKHQCIFETLTYLGPLNFHLLSLRIPHIKTHRFEPQNDTVFGH
jgi:hypothetical protein